MMNKNIYQLILFIMSFPILGQSQTVEEYISKGMESNLELQTKRANYQVAMRALDEARKQKSLRVDFSPTYTLAAGGRTIDIPVGDLLNPVYGSLNELTASNAFPQIENESELLNPNNFYDFKVRASYPILNKAIGVNQEIKSLETLISNFTIEAYKNELSAEIEKAYYDYQQATAAISIYEEAAILIKENIRVNRGLFKNGKALKIDVDAVVNDSIQMQKDIDNAQLTKTKAAAYVNFLINESLEQPIEWDSSTEVLPEIPGTNQLNTRPELLQLSELENINRKLKDLAEAQAGPQLNGFVDLGIQDFDFNIDGQSPYVLAGLSFNLNLFDNGQTKAKIALAESKAQEVAYQRANVSKQIELEQFVAVRNLETSFNNFYAAQEEVNLRQQQYNDQLKRYRLGTANYIAVQEARNKLITSQLQRNLNRYQAWKDVAEYKRTLGINTK